MHKKSYQCNRLEKTLNFLPDYIKYCCSYAICPGIEIEDINSIREKSILKERKRIIDLLDNGIIPKECKGCIEYHERKPLTFWERLKKRKNKIEYIVINHFKQCDCSCIYCSQKIIYPNLINNYQIMPILKKLYKKDLIDKNQLTVEFQGGNVSVLKEFDEIITFIAENHCKHIVILINGIKYLPILEKIQKTTPIELIISIDSGTKETFQRIKQVDKFNDVLENIKKYEQFPNIAFSLKYIIIQGVNDNIEELHNFLEIAKNVKPLYNVYIDIDFRNTFQKPHNEKFVVPKHYYEMIEFATKYSQDNNINFHVNPYSQMVLDKGEA